MASGTTTGHLKLLISNKLANDDALNAEVDGRVSDMQPDLKQVVEAEYPLVVTTFRAGRMLYSAVTQNIVFELWVYSRTSRGHATAVYDLAFAALQAELLVIDGVDSRAYCQETQRPTDGYDEDSRTWIVQTRWIARAVGG